MELLASSMKAIIRLFAFIIKRSPAAKKYLFSHALKDEVNDFVEHEYFSHYVHIEKGCELSQRISTGDGIIVDVGGADGTTPRIFSRYFPQTAIVIFEPIREHIDQLNLLCRSFPQWSVIPKAAGATESRATIHKAQRITSSSLFELQAEQDSAMFGDNVRERGTETVQITTLDKELGSGQDILILKIDVQGYELEVLKGATTTLPRVALIILEFNNHDSYVGAPKYFQLDDFLRGHQFELYDIFPSLKDNGKLKEWDAIYVRSVTK